MLELKLAIFLILLCGFTLVFRKKIVQNWVSQYGKNKSEEFNRANEKGINFVLVFFSTIGILYGIIVIYNGLF
jgi:hypothetical protein